MVGVDFWEEHIDEKKKKKDKISSCCEEIIFSRAAEAIIFTAESADTLRGKTSRWLLDLAARAQTGKLPTQESG